MRTSLAIRQAVSAALLATAMGLAGCGLPDRLFGAAPVTVLARGTVALGTEAIALTAPTPMTVSGNRSIVCFVVGDGVPLKDADRLDAYYAKAVDAARLSATLVLAGGQRIELSSPSVNWEAEGRVLGSGEVAGCVSPKCGTAPAAGAVIERIEARASAALTVRGVYFTSEDGPVGGATSTTLQSTCRPSAATVGV